MSFACVNGGECTGCMRCRLTEVEGECRRCGREVYTYDDYQYVNGELYCEGCAIDELDRVQTDALISELNPICKGLSDGIRALRAILIEYQDEEVDPSSDLADYLDAVEKSVNKMESGLAWIY